MLVRFICQKCKKESDPTSVNNAHTLSGDMPKEWRFVRFFANSFSIGTEYAICPDCNEKIGLPNYYNQQEQSLGDKIFDVFYEIAEQAAQENIDKN